MTTTATRSREQAEAHLQSIENLMTRYYKANESGNESEQEDIAEEIDEDALSARVIKMYEILLSTGGPAVRIIGELDDHNEPLTVSLEHQDWGTPWEYVPLTGFQSDLLLDYAGHYYFGE